MHTKTLALLITFIVGSLAPGAAFAFSCAADFADLVDQSVEVTPSDCLTASYLGSTWGGCSDGVALRLVNNCDTALRIDEDDLQLAGESFQCLDSDAGRYVVCDTLDPSESGQLRLPAPVEGDVQVVEMLLHRTDDGMQEFEVHAEYGARDIPGTSRDDGGSGSRAACSSTPASRPSSAALWLLLFAGAVIRRRAAM